MFTRGLKRVVAMGLLLLGGWAAAGGPMAWGQTELNRKVRSKVTPSYPELAKRMNLTGVVKILLTVSPNGTIKEAKLLGGHPLLANAALDAVKKWRFDASPEESRGIVEFDFNPNQ